ncbi:MAG: hypothetical protein ABI222_08680, partial [Opitutaceae bacterium]
ESCEGRHCSHPYNRTDLWNLYRHRCGKGWDRDQAQRLGLAEMFVAFDRMASKASTPQTADDRFVIAGFMLRSLSADETRIVESNLPRAVALALAETAKKQLSELMACDGARDLLIRAFLEGALIADVDRSTHDPAGE